MNRGADRMTEVTESQLREMFDAYAGPEGPKARSGRSRSPRPLALLAVVALAIAVSLAVFAYDRSDGVRSEGGLARVTAGPMRSIPFRISLDEMIAKSDLIFVGTVTTIEGPEELSPANPPDYPDPILAYRVTFEVERLLRGDVEREIEVTNTMGRGPAFSAEVGEEYLVFAAHDEVGYEHVPRLVAVGIDQGVFRVTGPNTAENSRTVTLQLDEVDRRVAGAERSDGGAS